MRPRYGGHCAICILTSSLALNDPAKLKEYDPGAGPVRKPPDSGEVRAIRLRRGAGRGE